MTRKRYVSTNISVDPRVRDLAERSEFAALLYTWMIPHADDSGCITADCDSLLMQVVPGFRWRTVADVEAAVGQMLELGLLERVDSHLRFPSRTFYKYQAYIGADRRPNSPDQPPPGRSRKSAQNHAVPRNAQESAQKSTSFKSSSSLINSPNGETVASEPESERDDQDATAPQPANEDECVERVFAKYKARVQPLSRLCPRKKIAARLQRFTVDELVQGIEQFAADPWWMTNHANHGAAWFFDSDEQAEKFLLLHAPPANSMVLVNGRGPDPPAPPVVDNTGIRRWT